MSLDGDLRAACQGVDTQAGTAMFCFSKELPLFQGHFPGQPILPGIAQVEMVRHTLDQLTGEDHALVQVKKTKFMQLIQPETSIEVALTTTPLEDGKKQVRATLKDGGQALAKINIILGIAVKFRYTSM